jgi:hypothetical protein
LRRTYRPGGVEPTEVTMGGARRGQGGWTSVPPDHGVGLVVIGLRGNAALRRALDSRVPSVPPPPESTKRPDSAWLEVAVHARARITSPIRAAGRLYRLSAARLRAGPRRESPALLLRHAPLPKREDLNSRPRYQPRLRFVLRPARRAGAEETEHAPARGAREQEVARRAASDVTRSRAGAGASSRRHDLVPRKLPDSARGVEAVSTRDTPHPRLEPLPVMSPPRPVVPPSPHRKPPAPKPCRRRRPSLWSQRLEGVPREDVGAHPRTRLFRTATRHTPPLPLCVPRRTQPLASCPPA